MSPPDFRTLADAVYKEDLEQFVVLFDRLDAEGKKLEDLKYEKLGDNLLHVLCRLGRLQMLQHLDRKLNGERLCLLIPNKEGKVPLHEAAQFCQADVVDWLLSKQSVRAEVDALKRADWTPLMLACTKRGNVRVVNSLLKAGAGTKLANKDGWTPFHLAVREGDLEVLEELLSADPDIARDTKSRNRRTPLHSAALAGHQDCLAWLISRHCYSSIDEKDSCGSTPLMDAARVGQGACLRLLVSSGGAKIQAKDAMGRNCLHIAAHSGRMDIVEMLVTEFGIDLNSVSDNGMTAMHWATRENHRQTVATLKRLGADTDALDDHRRSCRDVATEFGYKDIVALLDG